MLDIKFIRENQEAIIKGAENKNFPTEDIKKLIEIHDNYRSILTEVEGLRAERNKYAKERNIEEGKRIKQQLEEKEKSLNEFKKQFEKLILQVPNLPKTDVKVGKDDSKNEIIRTYKEPTTFFFQPRDHVELGELLDIIDINRATKVSGARFTYLKNEGVFLELALVRFAMDTLTKEGFIPIFPPVLIKKNITHGLGYWQAGGNEDYYLVADSDKESQPGNEIPNPLYLIGTAEHAIVPMYMNETLQEKELPKRYVGFSPAFRREAGTYGKDTRGILRMHQFDKVEMVSFVKKDEDDKEHEYLLSLEEKLFQALDIPYQVIKMCSGDLGFPAARKYDIEAWIPTQDKYREVTSVSTVTDFQSRRLNMKYRTNEGKEYLYVLNGTAFAIGRTLIAILENCQQEDGSVVIPQVLRQYTGFDIIKPK